MTLAWPIYLESLQRLTANQRMQSRLLYKHKRPSKIQPVCFLPVFIYLAPFLSFSIIALLAFACTHCTHYSLSHWSPMFMFPTFVDSLNDFLVLYSNKTLQASFSCTVCYQHLVLCSVLISGWRISCLPSKKKKPNNSQ